MRNTTKLKYFLVTSGNKNSKKSKSSFDILNRSRFCEICFCVLSRLVHVSSNTQKRRFLSPPPPVPAQKWPRSLPYAQKSLQSLPYGRSWLPNRRNPYLTRTIRDGSTSKSSKSAAYAFVADFCTRQKSRTCPLAQFRALAISP